MQAVRSVASGSKFYRLPPDMENTVRLEKECKYPAHFTSRAARDRDVSIFILKKELSKKVEISKFNVLDCNTLIFFSFWTLRTWFKSLRVK